MNRNTVSIPNQRLREARLSHYWSQQELAAQIGTTVVNVSRWERGITSPGPHFRYQLCTLFGMNAQELGLLPGETIEKGEQPTHKGGLEKERATSLEASASQQYLPYRRNPLFTGREDILLRLRHMLDTRQTAALSQAQAISGLGGIGKTQTVLEYAYRFRHDYSALFWARAETYNGLVTDFAAIAESLNLPEKSEQDHQYVIAVVKRWLKDTSGWLLILDNVEDFMMVNNFSA